MQVNVFVRDNNTNIPLLQPNELTQKVINWDKLQSKSKKKYIYFHDRRIKNFDIIFTSEKGYESNSPLVMLKEFYYLISKYFPQAYTTSLGVNLINLAKIIKNKGKNLFSNNNKVKNIASIYVQIKNRMSYSPALELVDDVMTKIFKDYLTAKDLHAFESTNRCAFEQASRIWQPAFLFNRATLLKMGHSLNHLLKQDEEWIGDYAGSGKIDKVKTLYDICVNPNKELKKDLNHAFLHSVADYKNPNWEHLLNLGADPYVCEDDKSTLFEAIKGGNEIVFKKIISNLTHVDIHFTCKTSGETVMHYAAMYDYHGKKMKIMFECGAEINVTDNKGRTPLHLACSHSNLEVVRYLIDLNVDINCPDDEGKTPLFYAMEDSSIFYHKNEYSIVEHLLKNKALINVSLDEHKGMTPLHYAIAKGNPEWVQVLLKYGANVNVPLSNGATPLIYFFEKCSKEMQRFPNCISSYYEIANELLAVKEIDIHVKDKLGRTPIQLAVNLLDIKEINIKIHEIVFKLYAIYYDSVVRIQRY